MENSELKHVSAQSEQYDQRDGILRAAEAISHIPGMKYVEVSIPDSGQEPDLIFKTVPGPCGIKAFGKLELATKLAVQHLSSAPVVFSQYWPSGISGGFSLTEEQADILLECLKDV